MKPFNWDDEKAEINLKKHGVSFEEAKSVFDDPFSFDINDPKHSIGEYRWIKLGYSVRQRLLVVSFTERKNRIRIISARIATNRERKTYEQDS